MEGETVAEAVAEVVAERTEAIIEHAEERIEAAQETAQAIADAAMASEHGRMIAQIREDNANWRTETETRFQTLWEQMTALSSQMMELLARPAVTIVEPVSSIQAPSLDQNIQENSTKMVAPESVEGASPAVVAEAPRPKARRLI